MQPPRLVTASAGTGKTYWIVERVKALLTEEGVRLEQVGVITFTEAAAAELRVRIGLALREAGRPEADEIGSAPIMTIHGFALSLVRRHALLSGLAAEPMTLDDAQAEALRRLALNQILEDPAVSEQVACLKAALDTWDLDKVRKLIFDMLERARSLRMAASAFPDHATWNREFLLDAFGPSAGPEALDAALEDALLAAEPHWPINPEFKKDDGPLKACRRAIATWRRGDRLDAARLAAGLKDGSKKLEPHLAPCREAAEVWLRQHPDHRDWLVSVSDAAYGLASRALARYGELKRARGWLDFNDQIGHALDLLEGGLAPYVAAEMPHLLIDEFQDTSPMQFRLAEVLRAHGGHVHYVGDMKQAIYGWRDADSRLMAALIASAPEAPHTLDRNWRSREELVSFCNDLFAPVFDFLGMPFGPVAAAASYPGVAAGPCVELVMREKSYYPGPEHLIPRIVELVESGMPILDRESGEMRPVRWGDVAVLERGNDALEAWAARLAAAGVPYSRSLGGWSEQMEVRGAIAWLRCLANPYDTQAIADALCSDYFSFEPTSLALLAKEGLFRDPTVLGQPEAWTRLADVLPSHEARVFRRFAAAWATAHAAIRHQPLTQAVRCALDALECDLRLAVYADAPQRRANLLRLVEHAATLEATPHDGLAVQGLTGATLEDFLAWLTTVPDSDLDKQPLVTERDPDAIQLITMHRAKGLEFPVVVVPKLSGRVQADAMRCEVTWPEDSQRLLDEDLFQLGKLRFVPPVADVGDLHLRLGRAEADASRAADESCLLYVAFTRARDYLMLGWLDRPRTGTLQTLLGVSLEGEALAGHPVRVTQCAEPMAAAPAVVAPTRLDASILDGDREEPAPAWWVPPVGASPPVVRRPSMRWEVQPLAGRMQADSSHDSRDLGLAVHAGLASAELLGAGMPDDVLKSRLGRRWGAELTVPALEAVELVRQLLQQLETRRLLREHPFLLSCEAGPVHGRIDALVETADGWWVLDYKTEPGTVEELVERHAEQMLTYRRAAEALLGARPKLGLVALGIGQLIVMESRES